MKPVIFLSYAKEDRPRVQRIYRSLRQAGLSPWMDKPPRPWNHEGLLPGQDWDHVIRARLEDSRMILIFLSRRSLEKRGYVQREYRLALNKAMEQPLSSITVIPVLLEPCRPPDIRVDTVSLRHFQWYELYEFGVKGLVEHLLNLLRPSEDVSFTLPRRIPQNNRQSQGQTLLEILSCIQITKTRYNEEFPNPAQILKRAMTSITDCDPRGLHGAMYAMENCHAEVDAKQATSALQKLREPCAATAVASILGCRFRYHLGEFGKYLRLWLDHPVPEVGAIASILLSRQRRLSSPVLELLAHYCRRNDRLQASQAILKLFLSYDHLLRYAQKVPELLWELLANDHHFGGMGQSHIPMQNPGRKFKFLTIQDSWKAREIGAAIYCADRKIKCAAKLHLLTDIEPRVRFRALEGVLLTSEPSQVEFIISALLENGVQEHESRLWQIQRVIGKPRLLTVALKDHLVHRPRFATGAFGRGACFDVYESINDLHVSLVGFATISAQDEQAGYIKNDEKYKLRTMKIRPKWTHKYLH